MSLDAAFARFPVLTTARLRLREPRAEDAEGIFALKSDPEVTAPYAAEPYRSIDQSRNWIRDRIADFARRDGLVWVVALAADDRAIGSVCYWHFEPGGRCAEVGYEFARPHWGRGIGTEAVGEVVRFGFAEMQLHRIEACPLARNAPSIRLLEKLGFRREGVLRDRVLRPGGFEDQLYLARLASDPIGAAPTDGSRAPGDRPGRDVR